MPTYDYVCDSCGHSFEEWQSFKDDPLKDCQKCGRPDLRRLFGGGAAIIFKGSGFYETDYRKDSYKEAAKKDAEAAKSTESKAEAKADPGPTTAKPTTTDATTPSKA